MIDWNDNAKTAVREFAIYIGQSDKCERYLERIAPKKTVADAVEAFPGGYDSIPYSPENIEKEQVVLCAKKTFFEDGEEYVKGNLYQGQKDFDNEYFYLVCTRAEFEAYVKEQEDFVAKVQGDFVGNEEREGEKWTHITNSGHKCKIHVKEPDVNGIIIVLNSDGEYMRHSESALKPIKPKIDESQAWVKMQSLIPKHGVTAAYQMTIQQYDII